jgi:A/G-specific adenine glycosylase
MLQQTVVATVIPYFLDFTQRWPTVSALARAPLDDVLAAWAGLGYYARARNLHKTATIVAEEWGGQFYCPDAGTTFSDNDWDRHFLSLPGIGPYTAGAISAIAYGRQAVVVDGNIERLFSRYFGIDSPLPAAKTEIVLAYESLLPVGRPSDFPQALMDFSNAVCTPKRPGCEECCLASSCIALAKGVAEKLPTRLPKGEKPLRRAIVFVAINHLGEVFLHRRPEKGLLGGMAGFPEIGLSNKTIDSSLDQKMAPFSAEWELLDEPVVHFFTHFALEAFVYFAHVDGRPDARSLNGQWQKPRPSDLPSLMRKIWMVISSQQLKGG